jgi:hypothetical protein
MDTKSCVAMAAEEKFARAHEKLHINGSRGEVYVRAHKEQHGSNSMERLGAHEEQQHRA